MYTYITICTVVLFTLRKE